MGGSPHQSGEPSLWKCPQTLGKSAQRDPAPHCDLNEIGLESFTSVTPLAGMYLAFLAGKEIETGESKDESHTGRGERDRERG